MRSLGRTAVQFRMLGPLGCPGWRGAVARWRAPARAARAVAGARERAGQHRADDRAAVRGARGGGRPTPSTSRCPGCGERSATAGRDTAAPAAAGTARARADQLDAAGFERLVHEGRATAGSRRPSAALGAAARGARLWRGPPLADLAAVDFVQAEVRRLEELRLLAEMERIDAELTLGRTASWSSTSSGWSRRRPSRSGCAPS